MAVMESYLVFIMATALIGLTLWRNSPVLAFFAGLVSFMFGFEMIGTVWLAMIFWGLGLYFMLSGVFWRD